MKNPLKAIGRLPGKVVRGVNRKVWASTTGAVIAAPVMRIIMWVLTDPQFGIGLTVPDDVAQDFQDLVNMAVVGLGALVGGYFVPERKG